MNSATFRHAFASTLLLCAGLSVSVPGSSYGFPVVVWNGHQNVRVQTNYTLDSTDQPFLVDRGYFGVTAPFDLRGEFSLDVNETTKTARIINNDVGTRLHLPSAKSPGFIRDDLGDFYWDLITSMTGTVRDDGSIYFERSIFNDITNKVGFGTDSFANDNAQPLFTNNAQPLFTISDFEYPEFSDRLWLELRPHADGLVITGGMGHAGFDAYRAELRSTTATLVQSVPEPTGVELILTGMLCVIARRRNKRQSV